MRVLEERQEELGRETENEWGLFARLRVNERYYQRFCSGVHTRFVCPFLTFTISSNILASRKGRQHGGVSMCLPLSCSFAKPEVVTMFLIAVRSAY